MLVGLEEASKVGGLGRFNELSTLPTGPLQDHVDTNLRVMAVLLAARYAKSLFAYLVAGHPAAADTPRAHCVSTAI